MSATILDTSPARVTAEAVRPSRAVPDSARRLDRLHAWHAPALVALAIGALYLWEASPAVGGGNSGEFQVMAHVLGIAHPPSYPLYLLMAKGASLVPLPGDVAWRINLLTAAFAGLAVFLTGLLPGALSLSASRRRVATMGALAAAATGAMPRLWTLAVEAEVFSLHLTLVIAFWLSLARWQVVRRDRWLLLAALFAGLGLANHRTMLFFGAAGLLFVLSVEWRALTRGRLLAGSAALAGLGLTPYLYVARGLFWPVAYFSPSSVQRLSRADVWYVLQGNASGETGGGEVIRQLFTDPVLLDQRVRWLLGHLAGQFGPLGGPLAILGACGLVVLAAQRLRWTVTALLGSAGAAVFAMSYAKYPDADRYLLPLETLLAAGTGILAGAAIGAIGKAFRSSNRVPVAGTCAVALLLGGYWTFTLVGLASRTEFTRGGYVHHTLHNLEAVQPNAVVCTWWAASWGWWYAQFVDGVRPDVSLVPKGPDDCVRDVVPGEFGRRAVYLPALTDRVRQSDFVLFPSRDLWLVVARREALRDGMVLKGPDERIYLYRAGHRHWLPGLDVFAAHGFTWDDVYLMPDYVLRTIPEGEPLS